jgi:hypothetical protein
MSVNPCLRLHQTGTRPAAGRQMSKFKCQMNAKMVQYQTISSFLLDFVI